LRCYFPSSFPHEVSICKNRSARRDLATEAFLQEQVNSQRILLLVLYPVISILPFLLIWQFKFGSLLAGSLMALAWVGLLIFTVRKIAALEIRG
jgi:hypothetical protein